MEILIKEFRNKSVAHILAENIIINEIQDALDIMADCNYNGVSRIIIDEKNITPDFFDLKSGIAGEILQKFSTYKVKLAIIGDFTKFSSKSLKDFILESNKYGHINFVNTLEEALIALTN